MPARAANQLPPRHCLAFAYRYAVAPCPPPQQQRHVERVGQRRLRKLEREAIRRPKGERRGVSFGGRLQRGGCRGWLLLAPVSMGIDSAMKFNALDGDNDSVVSRAENEDDFAAFVPMGLLSSNVRIQKTKINLND